VRFLALTGEDKLGVVGGFGLLPAAARFAQRWRMRVATRIAGHTELVSPLAAKVAAGAIAFGVVGGAVTSAGTAPGARPTEAPPAVTVQGTNAATAHPIDAARTVPVANAGAIGKANVTSTVPASARVAKTPPERSLGPAHFKSYDEARHEGSKAPIRAEVAGTGVGVDPAATLQYATDVIANRRTP
jgi:hypothetical protein